MLYIKKRIDGQCEKGRVVKFLAQIPNFTCYYRKKNFKTLFNTSSIILKGINCDINHFEGRHSSIFLSPKKQ